MSCSEELRHKRSQNQQGEKNSFYGKHHTEETKEKIRQKNLGGTGGTGFVGRTHSPETKTVMGLKSEERWRDPKLRAKTLKGIIDAAPEVSKKIKALWQDPEYREAITNAMRVSWQGNPEGKEKLRQAQKLIWQDPEYAARHIKAHLLRPNHSEQFLIDLFQSHNLPFRYVGDGEFILGGKCPDFLNTNGQKQLIELYGAYWHPESDVAERTEYFKQYGFSTLIIWEDELDSIEELLTRVKDFMEEV